MSTIAPIPPVTTEFSYRQKTFDLSDTEGQVKALHEDGFALIPGVLSAEEVQATKAAIDRLQPFANDHVGKTDHYKCVFNRERFWTQYLDRPGIIELAEGTMGEHCHLLGMTAWRSYPGHNGWGPHTDHTLVTVPEEVASDPSAFPIYLCTAHFYLNDITEDLCPTWVIPGSHKSGHALQWAKGTEVQWHGQKMEPVLCKAGDVLFFRSEVWHSGSENKTADQIRYLLQVHYSNRTLAQRFAPWPFVFNQEIILNASERQLRLLGKHPEMAYG